MHTQGLSLRSVAVIAAALALSASACSSNHDDVAVVEATEAEVVAAYVDRGVAESVASCIVGIGQDEFDLAELLPPPEGQAPSPLVAEIVTNCQAANDLINGENEPENLAFDDPAVPFDYGDDAELDALWDACEVGDGAACDELWESAPVGSKYEEFGVTCGERFEVLNCTDELVSAEASDS